MPRAARRHQDQRIKAKVARVVARWGGRNLDLSKDPKFVGQAASVHCRACSCWMCQPDPGPSHAEQRRIQAAEDSD